MGKTRKLSRECAYLYVDLRIYRSANLSPAMQIKCKIDGSRVRERKWERTNDSREKERLENLSKHGRKS